jgi:hypothetical protein
VSETESMKLKPQDFQNNDGTDTQMGRWTRDEHEKFLAGMFVLFYNHFYSFEIVRKRLAKSLRIHKN